LMWKFQQPLPEARPGEKWILMEKIFKLQSNAEIAELQQR
jgi:L-rhamnose mutarotase